MNVVFDSNNPTKRPRIIGEGNGTPRIWTVQLRAEGIEGMVTFKSKGKVYIRDLAEMVDEYILAHIKVLGVTIGRIRWTATAR